MENRHNLSAADKAISEISTLTGHRVERGPGEFDHLSDDELLESLRERFARLFGETQHLAARDGAILLNGASRTLKDRDR